MGVSSFVALVVIFHLSGRIGGTYEHDDCILKGGCHFGLFAKILNDEFSCLRFRWKMNLNRHPDVVMKEDFER